MFRVEVACLRPFLVPVGSGIHLRVYLLSTGKQMRRTAILLKEQRIELGSPCFPNLPTMLQDLNLGRWKLKIGEELVIWAVLVAEPRICHNYGGVPFPFYCRILLVEIIGGKDNVIEKIPDGKVYKRLGLGKKGV
jgi:hypothetical protein